MAGGEGDDVVEALVVALGVVVLHKVAEHGAQMTFAEGDNVPEALVLDGPNDLSAWAFRFGLLDGRRDSCTPAAWSRVRKCAV